jgi:alkyldihydroxyacetonephosphate synthase
MSESRTRRLGGWGFEGEAHPPSPQLLQWLEQRIGAAGRALVDEGAALSHHHGIGQWHAPWYEQEVGLHGRRMVEAAVRHMDPEGVLNPHVLLDPDDRLEV